MKLPLHVKLHKAVATQNRSNSQPHMPLKKHSFNDNEEPISEEAVIYKRGEYWQMRMWLVKEHNLWPGLCPKLGLRARRKGMRSTF